MGNENDSWLNYFGVDVGKFLSDAATTVTDSIPGVSSIAAKPKPTGSGVALSGSVGKGGKNKPDDVKMVQAALDRNAGAGLKADGDCGALTIKAIKAFQKSLGMAKPDGRVDPGKGTALALFGGASPNSGPNAPSQEDNESGSLLDRIIKGVENVVDDVIHPGAASGSEAESDLDVELIAKLTKGILAKLKAGKKPSAEIQVLEGTDMRSLLEVMARLKQAGKLEALLNHVTAENRRVGVAALTIKPEFNDQWRERVADLSAKDREAVLERTPDAVKKDSGFGGEPAEPESEEDDEDPAEGEITVDEAVAVEAKLAFKAKGTSLGKTEFTVKLDPSGSLKAFDVDLTLIEGNLQTHGPFSDLLSLDASLSLNASAELTKEQTKTVFEGVQKAVKAQIRARFKRIRALKKVSLQFWVTGGAKGFDYGGGLVISIPGT